jgi:hypothetical protein
MRPEPVRISLPRRDRAFDTQSSDARRILAQARPEQIRRLIDDIRNSGASGDPLRRPRGTA